VPKSLFVPSNRPRDFALEAGLGKSPGVSTVNKFGTAPDADSGVPTDVWDGADGVTSTDIWVAPTAARIHTIVSASDVDSDSGGSVAQGAGLRTLRVYYLPDWDTAEATEDVVMDGTTGKAMVASAVMIHRMHGLTWGANGVNTGIITATAATDSTITAMITAGSNQTLMAIYGVPSIQTLSITHVGLTVLRTAGTVDATAELLVNTAADTDPDAFLVKDSYSLTENAPLDEDYTPYKVFTGPLIAKLQVTTNTNNSVVTGRFDAYVTTN